MSQTLSAVISCSSDFYSVLRTWSSSHAVVSNTGVCRALDESSHANTWIRKNLRALVLLFNIQACWHLMFKWYSGSDISQHEHVQAERNCRCYMKLKKEHRKKYKLNTGMGWNGLVNIEIDRVEKNLWLSSVSYIVHVSNKVNFRIYVILRPFTCLNGMSSTICSNNS